MTMVRDQLKALNFTPKSLVPMITAIVAALIMILPLGTTTASYAMPHLVLMTIFYWSNYRPIQMPLGGVALIGLFLDLWLAVPLGLNMLLALLTRVFVMAQLRHLQGRSPFVQWAIFAILITGLSIISWVLVSFVYREFIAIMPAVKQGLLTIFIYPLVTMVLSRIRATLS
jgi:rod shape-determining protein MreD